MDWAHLLGSRDGDRTDVGRAFDALLNELRAARKGGRDPAARLEEGANALLGVMTFLNTHPVIATENLMAPLTDILGALLEARMGGRPALLFDQPSVPHRPPSPRIDAVRGAVAFCIELLPDFNSGTRNDTVTAR